MVLSEATNIDIKLIMGKSTNLTSPCCLVDQAGVLTRQSTRRRPSREADFLSVYHLIGPINRPETLRHTIKASFELHCGM